MITRALALAALLAATPALAGDALPPERVPDKARRLAERGRVYHQAGNYSAAIAAFKDAYVLAPSPGLLFNIAQAYRLAGNCDEAAWMYRRFLDASPVGPHRELARSHLETVEKCSRGALRVATPAPTREVFAVPDLGRASAAVELQARGRKLQRLGIGTAIAGGALLAGAALFALDAHDAAQVVSDTYERGGKWDDIAADDARGRRSSALAAVLGVSGGAAIVSGIVMFAVGRHHEQVQHVAVTPTRRGAQVTLSWGF